MPLSSELIATVAGKLAESGIDYKDMKALGLSTLTREQSQDLGFDLRAAIRFDYKNPDGTPVIAYPNHPPFFRIRYVTDDPSFTGMTEDQQRYCQPPGSSVAAYFPTNVAWREILGGKDPIIITEGELKAICGASYGYSVLGLGGVHNFKSLESGVTFLAELKRIDWIKRKVYICFDSDYLTNPQVCNALKELGEALVNEGAFVYVITLPNIGPKKTGLDDYLIHEKAVGFQKLIDAAQPLGLTRPLFNFNDKYVYVRRPGLILGRDNFDKISPDAFTGHLEATTSVPERVVLPNGSISQKTVSAAKAWLRWPLRKEATALTYSPGQPREVGTEINVWTGWGVEPKKGDVKPFLKLIDHLFTDAEPEAKGWFLQWLAYPLQFPGTKLFTSAVFHGVLHGTGKSLLGYTMGRIYGKNFTEIRSGSLQGGFNEWAESKQFVLGDDVTGSDKRQDADILKTLITQRELRVNIKYIPSYTVPDCINYLFTSNHPDAFFLEDDDRRFFIHEVTVGPLEGKFYADYAGVPGAGPGWLDRGGSAAVFDFLLNLDLKGFNPAAAAMRTQAKIQMTADMQSDVGTWVRQLKADPDTVLRLGQMPIKKDLFTSKELLAFYDPEGRLKVTANGMAREMRRAGGKLVCGGRAIPTQDGRALKYFPCRRITWWKEKTIEECSKHLNDYGSAHGQQKQAKF